MISSKTFIIMPAVVSIVGRRGLTNEASGTWKLA